MKLSEHFTLTELTRSQVAARLGIDNTPTSDVVEQLKLMCELVLEPIRTAIGRPIVVTSGYRSRELNRRIGGAQLSDHIKGTAADIECPGVPNWELAKAIAASEIGFWQLILEHSDYVTPESGWVHVSMNTGGFHRQLLRAEREPGKTVYRSGLLPTREAFAACRK